MPHRRSGNERNACNNRKGVYFVGKGIRYDCNIGHGDLDGNFVC